MKEIMILDYDDTEYEDRNEDTSRTRMLEEMRKASESAALRINNSYLQ